MAFHKSKKLVQSANLLVHFSPDLELILASDASDYGVGAVLSYRMADGTDCPIGYVLRSLNTAEHGYSTIEKAIICRVKKFHLFLYGQKFTSQTDHKLLVGLFNKKKGVPNKPLQEFSSGPLPWQHMTTRLPIKQRPMQMH